VVAAPGFSWTVAPPATTTLPVTAPNTAGPVTVFTELVPVVEIVPVTLPAWTMPPLTLNWPVKLLEPVRVSVPPPALVRSAVPEICVLTRSWPTSTCTMLGTLSVIGPASVLVPLRLSSVPPLSASDSLRITPPCSCSVAPDATSVPDPLAVACTVVPLVIEALAVVSSCSMLLLPPRAELFWTLTMPPRMFV
jgi:hypothetical protein